MEVLKVRNVNEALMAGLRLIKEKGVPLESRNGPVLEIPGPVTTVYEKPRERVIFFKERDANPFFHFFECLWMLGGRNDVKLISKFNNQIKNYSDDEVSFHWAYGYRWRKHYKGQIAVIIEKLKRNSLDRRAVLAMWDANIDLEYQGKDLPCNTHIYFWVRENKLNMTVCNRSNDLIWGAYVANAVHMSFLQEVIASHIGVAVGTYNQISNNLHVYTATASSKVYERCLVLLDTITPERFLYSTFYSNKLEQVIPYPIVKDPSTWFLELDLFLEDPITCCLTEPFFMNVAKPLWLAYAAYKEKLFETAQLHVRQCRAVDWRLACREWLNRRVAARLKVKL